jgi:hypothetical protein
MPAKLHPNAIECHRGQIREFLDWVHERALAQDGMNPGRTANKAREHLRAVISWAWEQELIDTLPRFPKPREQRDVAGRHYLTKAEINGGRPGRPMAGYGLSGVRFPGLIPVREDANFRRGYILNPGNTAANAGHA